jgi:RNA polymerase sigma-70 factor (ECF subfamily)
VDAYRDKVFNTALNIIQDEDEALDTAQDVFVQIYESMKEFRQESSLSTWIYRITIRKALDKVRKRKRRQRLLQWTPWGNKDRDINFYHPGIVLENKEKAALLFKAISALPDKQRTAFTLIKVQRMSYQEAGDIMQQSIKAMESLISRARQNLQKKLRNYYQS